MKMKIRSKYEVIIWAFKQAWEIDKKNLLYWIAICIGGALLPVLFLSAIKNVIDIIAEQAQEMSGFGNIMVWISALVGFLFLHAVYGMLPSIFDFTLFTRFAVGMQKKLGEFVRKVPLSLFDNPDFALKVDMTTPTIKRLSFFLGSFLKLLGETAAICSLLILAASTSWILLLFGLVLITVSLAMGFLNAIEEHKRWVNEGPNERLAEYYYSLVFESSLAMEYRMLNLDPFIRERWFHIIKPMQDRAIALQNRVNLRNNVSTIMATLFKGLLMAAGLYLLTTGSMSIGTLVIFAAVFDQLAGSSSNLGRMFMQTYKYTKDFELQKSFLETDFESGTRDGTKMLNSETTIPNSDKPVVFELQGVSFQYTNNSDKFAIEDISLKIHQGEIVALVGSNGAGKSTLIKLLLGFYRPTQGHVFFEGKDYDEIDLSKLVQRIGVTFQDYAKFELTLRENIAFGDLSKLHEDAVLKEAAGRGGASKLLERQEKGLDTHLGRWYHKNAIQLSGGEWQRIAASRAHVSERNIIIMDEPAAMLDPIAEMEQFHHIKGSIQNRTGILVSHRIGFARLADKVAVLDQGKLIEYGTHAELMANRGTYYKLFTAQAEWYQQEVAM
jgi:ATP-binding cassette, subfamily B, bacterial